MDNYEFKIKCEEDTINKYIENKNFQKVGLDIKDRYCSKEDISTLEFKDYTVVKYDNEGANEYFKNSKPHLSLKRNFISDVEEDDLVEIMCKLENQISEEEYHNDGDGEIISLKKCMKSLVRIVHRFRYTREHHIPVTETHQSRDANSIW